jgi:mercuric ion binding protein
MKTITNFLIVLTFVLTTSFTVEKPMQATKNVTEKFWVNGNCEMCQNRIQKAALSVKGVKYASWDIETDMLTVIYNPEKCTLDSIKKAIADVGHDNDVYKAPDEIYNNLHSCCKYERK